MHSTWRRHCRRLLVMFAAAALLFMDCSAAGCRRTLEFKRNLRSPSEIVHICGHICVHIWPVSQNCERQHDNMLSSNIAYALCFRQRWPFPRIPLRILGRYLVLTTDRCDSCRPRSCESRVPLADCTCPCLDSAVANPLCSVFRRR